MANHDRETPQPTCQNCATSTTPLWRRDEMGAVLCNACGLFLKLHGRARPISLKTDVIKSRNRVKTLRPDLSKQKKQNHNLSGTDMNGGDPSNPNNGSVQRQSQKSVNGHGDDTNSPISRTGTPNMYNPHMAPLYHSIDDQFQTQQMPSFNVSAVSPGRAPSPMNGERLDLPQTHELLLSANASLKTRVSELEVIQELYRGRLHQLEQEENLRQSQEPGKTEAQLRLQLDATNEAHSQLQKELDESHRRENMLKRRLDELEVELKEVRESSENQDNLNHKRQRLDDVVPKSEEASTPQSVS
ncbi:hypothetical protein B0T24DRAFT_685436 [Lasiosphaeria ovina]|uniref:GATA-type domain-containing protein n=1 Tax=Lasiosphaeria ovina TaxID=92902 RepID=A0AAE0JS23_9PEZI|nr:hypothetical protein B0T24DRAFT_685436 [Lasiosphaeria ovina]